MKYIFMAKQTRSSLWSLKYMIDHNTDVVAAVVKKGDNTLRQLCLDNNIPLLSQEELVKKAQYNSISADYIISYYWKIIPDVVLKIPRKGGINFHPGPLPEARGSGYHVAILENWGYWGVTAHFMDEQYDTGDIIVCKRFPIAPDIVNTDLVFSTQEHLFELFKEVFDRIESGEKLTACHQKDGIFYDIKEIDKFKGIEDTDDTDRIHRKIRAFWNPPYSGATISIHGEAFTVIDDRILEWIHSKLIEMDKK